MVSHSLKVLFVFLMMKMSSAATAQNLCSSPSVLRTRTSCHSCSISMLMPCPVGYKQTPGSTAQDCKYNIQTPSLTLAISGCSFQCYREEEMKTCCPGFWGPDCMECPGGADRACSNKGVCSDGLEGNGTCSCQVGFAGTACEDCSAGRYGSTCSSVCSCLHGLCDSGLKGDGRCTCFSGYKGPQCDQELPECVSLSCQPNSRCVEEALTGQLVCRCLPGYQKSGAQCLPINPCLQWVCHTEATCVHTGPNQHHCACNHGYSGDGRVCVAIDPCQTDQGGCSAETASCVYDGPGKSHCECLPGFDLLSAGGCSLKESCTPESCHQDATCSTVGPGRVQCACLQGYIGNGKVCYGNIMQRLNALNTEPGGRWSGQLSSAITLFGSLSWPLQNLGPFTLFVPINEGFRGVSASFLTADPTKAAYLCKMHLVAGVMTFDSLKKKDVFYTLTGKSAEQKSEDSQTKIRIHGNRRKGAILQSDLVASNGMIHIISKLMDGVAATVQGNSQENMMKIIHRYWKFNKFEYLLERAGLGSLLDRPGPITVFAPTSLAFEAMAEGHLVYLSSAEGRNKLLELLRNHIVPSSLLEVFNAVSSPRIQTMANQVLTINVTENGQILVNGVPVLEAAVEAKNGHLYVMDGILTPPSIEPVLPHRCDINETKVIKGDCVSCLKLSQCSTGVFTGSSTMGCFYRMSSVGSAGDVLFRGCQPLCNVTVTTPACCSGFYGPDCRACPGGHQTPCHGHGQCLDGIGENGSCICDPNFTGSSCQFCSSFDKYGPNCNQTCRCIFGLCDNRLDSNGSCKVGSCQMGSRGTLCSRSVSCQGTRSGHRCHANAFCDFSQGRPRCVCKPGFKGNGITCLELDPCAPPLRGGCSLNAKCLKTGPGTHTCQCLTGWREDGDECQPINNCDGPDRGGCSPNATCIYVGPGQSDCSCNAGYKGNGLSCEPLNQCVTVSGGCHYWASCLLKYSRWTCVCDAGFVGDGLMCMGTVGEALMAFPKASEFSMWMTDSGLIRSLSDQNLTLLVPSSAAIAKMSSEDKNFWTKKGNLPSLVRNHMILDLHPSSSLSSTSSLTSLLKTTLPVSTTNELTAVGGAIITTADIAATNGLIHVIDKVLVPDVKLSEGLLATLALRPDLSLFRSYLINYNLTDEIQQTQEFTVFAPTDSAISAYLKEMAAAALDVNTTRYHVASQRLLTSDLQSGGYKQTLLGSSFQLAIYPRDGKLFVNDAQIESSDLLSGEGVIHSLTAVLHINRNHCDDTKYNKVMGSCVDCLFPQSRTCPNDTIPDKTVKRKKCLFTRIFEGERLLTIGCRSTCLQKTTVLRCCDGFFGQHCEPCPGPRDQPCFGNGACSDGTNGTGICRCDKGFNGTACETCQSGKYGVHCDQDCSCKNGRCSEGPKGDGTCECEVGWRGILCDQKIESRADELCGSVKCHSSANCVIRPDGPQCHCAAGFQGNGTYCQATDMCQVKNGGCSVFAVCKRTRPGLRDCVCNSGYSGDGLVCVEINPCLKGNVGCHGNADCIHTGPNKTSCSCRDGFTGDGQNCKMIDLCQKKNGGCHQFARCNTTDPGVRTCTCKSNFIGDGIICRGTVGREILTRKLRDFYLSLMAVDISLNGRGPFTVFPPNPETFSSERNSKKMKSLMSSAHKEEFASIVRSHIVMCHTLLFADLARPRNLTSLSGLVLTTRSTKDDLFINEASVMYSDGVSINGIFHEINKILLPPDLDPEKPPAGPVNLTDVAERHGYKTFYKLLEDTGVMDLVNDGMYQPVTVFLPSDGVMASLPQEQKDFLFHPDNRPQLVEYLKYHILQAQKVYAEGLIHLDSVRTLQGSPLSFTCGGTDDIGEIFVNDGKCRIVQRHLIFNSGLAYGISCLLTPPSLGGRCDQQTTFDLQMSCGLCSSSSTRCPKESRLKEVQKCDLPNMFISKNSGCRSVCTVNFWQPKCCHGYYGRDCLVCPGGVSSPCSNHGKCDDGHLGNGTCTCDTGFRGMACDQCSDGFYGTKCEACRCSDHGSCDAGRKGTGSCFCEEGWTGERCETPADLFVCSPSCSPQAVCQANNTCVCQPFYEGDGITCTVMDMCQTLNGGCAKVARCSQKGEQVSCTCPKGYSGDGFTCQPIDPCVSGVNGGCHEHAVCTMMSPGKKRCTCKDNYIGDGLTCQVKQLPISRCLQGNGQCHGDAKCTDLHFEDAKLGVFHVRSDDGQYKLNFSAAQQACAAQGASLASYEQLAYAQQGGLNMCAAGWLDQARVSYPTTYSNPLCGFGHIGIVDYGTRKKSETWDAFCYRMKEVKCECNPGYLGDGFSCIGNLLQVLKSTPTFSNFLTQILNCSQVSEAGKQFVKRLTHLTVQSTLFVPDNNGLPGNKTLSHRDLEFHLSEGQALPLSQLKNGSQIRTRVGSLTVLGVMELLSPSALSSCFINGRFVTDSDIWASNGIIHVLQGPLEAPPTHQQMHAAHKAGIGAGMVLLVVLVAAALFVGYHFYNHNTKAFRFHYFKEDEDEEDVPPAACSDNICNPVYEAEPEPEPRTCGVMVEDKPEEVDRGSFDLLQE